MQQNKSIILEFIKKLIFLFNTKVKPLLKKIAQKIGTASSTFMNREKLIRENYDNYKAGQIGTQKKREQEYKEAIFKHRFVGWNFSLLMKLYTRYLYPNFNNQAYILPGEFKLLLTTPQDYILMTKMDYQNEISKQVQDQLADKINAVREEFIEKLLPFTSGKQKSDLDQDYFAQKDASRVNYYSQQKRLEKIEERERKTILKEEKLDLTENKLDAQREQMEVKNERLGLQSDKLDLEKEHLNIDKKHLDVQKEKLGVQEDKISVTQDRIELEKIQIANERKLFELHMTRQEIEHKTKMLELANLSLEQQKKHNDVEQTKREMEITQALHDLETRKREQTLEYGQELLQLKEQGLENKLALKEADFLSLQMDNKRTQINIENKILDLRDGEFKQKSQEQLLEIKERKVGLEIDRMNIHKNERRLEDRNSDLKNQLQQERISVENTRQKMYDEQENLKWQLRDGNNRLYNVEKENGRLMRDLGSKPSYINWQDV